MMSLKSNPMQNPCWGGISKVEIMGGNHFFRIPCVIRNLKIQMSLCETG